MDSIQRHAGYWWLPNHQNKMITGTLYIEEDGNTYLETIGLLDEDFIHKTYYDVIWGMTSNAKPVSLFRCGLSVSRNTACFFSTGKYSASVVAVGKHISSLNETDNYNVCVDIEELNYWHRPSLIHLDNQFDHVDFDDEQSIDVSISDTTKLKIRSIVERTSSGGTFSALQKNLLIFEHAFPISIYDIKKEVFVFEQFLSFATLTHVQYKKLTLVDKNIPEGQPFPDEIDIYEKKDIVTPSSKFFRYLFTYDIIQDNFPSIIKKWYSDKELMPIRNFLIDSVCGKDCYTSTRFLMIMQALNGYFCRYRGVDIATRKWLAQLKREFGSLSKMDCLTPEELDEVGYTRDIYSHFLKEDSKPSIADDYNMRRYIFALRKYLICCMLNTLGLENDQISTIFRKSDNYYLDSVNRIYPQRTKE